jgi:hypothetical protein
MFNGCSAKLGEVARLGKRLLSTWDGDVFAENVTLPVVARRDTLVRMRLSSQSVRMLKSAYRADFGRELSDAEAESLGAALLETLGPLVLRRARDMHRSNVGAVDDVADKRDAGDPPSA